MIGRSDIKPASCSQGAITHRIPLFYQEAIAKWPSSRDFHALCGGGRGNRQNASRLPVLYPYSKGNRPSSRYSFVSHPPMISIRSSLTELERNHQIRAAVMDCYVLAIKNIAHYAVELDEELTGPHRKHLEALATEVASGTSEALSDSRATLRGLLRDYRDKACQYLGGLRDELAGTARTLEEILD